MALSTSFATERVVVVAFSGWADASGAATYAAGEICRLRQLEPRAQMQSEPYYDLVDTRPVAVLDDDGETQLVWPAPTLYGAADGDRGQVLVLQGAEPARRWVRFADELMDLLTHHGVERIILTGAMLLDTPHTRPIPAFLHSIDPDVRAELSVARSGYEGPVAVHNVLAERARSRGLAAVSVWACVPSYLDDNAAPVAVSTLLRQVGTLLGLPDLAAGREAAETRWRSQVDRMVAADAELSDYVRSLEREHDEGLQDAEGT